MLVVAKCVGVQYEFLTVDVHRQPITNGCSLSPLNTGGGVIEPPLKLGVGRGWCQGGTFFNLGRGGGV